MNCWLATQLLLSLETGIRYSGFIKIKTHLSGKSVSIHLHLSFLFASVEHNQTSLYLSPFLSPSLSLSLHLNFISYTRTMSKFEYPMLPRSDIIAILNESKIATVYEDNLINPNPDFVSDLYTRLLIHLDSLQYYPFPIFFFFFLLLRFQSLPLANFSIPWLF